MPDTTAQPMVIAWIQTTMTLRAYLGALPLPITIGDPTDPTQLATLGDDLDRAYHVINDAPIPTAHADLLRETICLLLMALAQFGTLLKTDSAFAWQAEGVQLLLRQANGKLNSLND